MIQGEGRWHGYEQIAPPDRTRLKAGKLTAAAASKQSARVAAAVAIPQDCFLAEMPTAEIDGLQLIATTIYILSGKKSRPIRCRQPSIDKGDFFILVSSTFK